MQNSSWIFVTSILQTLLNEKIDISIEIFYEKYFWIIYFQISFMLILISYFEIEKKKKILKYTNSVTKIYYYGTKL